ncbi:homeobox protein HEX homolog pha-2-like [Dreissena polymorpha]|uniref:Homeobox domain-containing protein n=1 Tax=Dreissena polymorpha TaxID=45954 RepID=A0A9D4F0T9_DREPO|nr:homeobox protein HEX homolog pha-2-like [Dreissena polymorpha]KAH3789762.1 hypothetical protein DPMN_167950 [Dreissena polymorpha]
MQATSAHMMAMANTFWPFAYSMKSYDMSLHPAFLSQAYRTFPSLPTVPFCLTNGQTNARSTQSHRSKSDKFSIDAILNSDRRPESTSSSDGADDSNINSRNLFLDNEKSKETFISRRHQRLLEATHPYQGHPNALADIPHLTSHTSLSSAYIQQTESPGQLEKCESKSPPALPQSTWSKQSKGKRVRTIFTPEQLERMEAEFERQQYMVGTERYYLASSLNLTEAQVKVWFQNRRIKWRKQHLEQQKAKLGDINMYAHLGSESDDDSNDEHNNSHDVTSRHVKALADPFQSPQEVRSLQ